MSKVNRALLESFYQNKGEVYDDTKTEGAFQTLADQIDTNDTEFQAHNHDSRYYTKSQTTDEINKAITTGSNTQIIETRTTFPTSPTEGQSFFHETEKVYYIYVSGTWQQTTDVEKVRRLERNQAQLLAVADIDGRAIPNSGKFYDLLDGTNDLSNGQIDLTKSTVVGALSIGDTVLTVEDATGFSPLQEVTLYDDTNLERVVIQSIAGNNLTVTALTKSFKDKSNIARSMAVYDTTNQLLKFGGWSTATNYTVTDATVVASAYDTSGNGGRKLVKLDDGTQVSALKDGLGFYLFKSADGTNWTQFYSNTVPSALGDICLETDGTHIFYLVTKDNNTINVFSINIDGTNNGFTSVDTVQSAFNGVSMIRAGTELHATWSSKNASLPNSWNIRYAKGTINADGSVTWGAVEQRTQINTSGADYKNPSITVKGDGNPLIVAEFKSSTTDGLYAFRYDGSTWNSATVYQNNGYTQSSPSAIFVPQSVNGLANGRIWVAWHGYDSSNTTNFRIRTSYSDDGGITWSTMQLVQDISNTLNNVSITANKNGDIFFVYRKFVNTSDNRIVSSKLSNDTWAHTEEKIISANGNIYPSTLFDPTFTLNFIEPLFIYQDNENSKVGFYGTWTVGSETPLLENDIRYNIDPPTGTTDGLDMWVQYQKGVTITASASIVDTASSESYTAMTDMGTTELDSTHDEKTFSYGATAEEKANIRITMTRATTSDNEAITKILGSVA